MAFDGQELFKSFASGDEDASLLGCAPFEPLPEDFQVDDLFTADLMQFLSSSDSVPPAAGAAEAPQAPGCSTSVGASSLQEQQGLLAPPATSSPSPSSSAGSIPASPQLSAGAASPATAPATTVIPSACTSGPRLPAPLSACAPALRLVTTQLLNQSGVSADAHYAAAAALIAACPKLSSQQLSNSEDSDDTCDGDEVQGANGSKPNKRKAPEIDWRAIEDPAERRRQRRLAKNRVTAARSRERKKLQWADMEVKIQALENENSQMRAVLEQFARENAALKEQLLSLANGAKPTGHGRSGRNSTTAEPAALVLIATLLVLCCFLPADKAMMVGSAVPVLIAMQLLLQQQVKDGSAAFDALIRTLAQLKGLLAKSSRGLKRYMNCVLYKRHYFCGRKLMRELVKIHSSDTTSDAAAAEADAKAAAQKQQHASSPSSAVPASSRDLACAMDIDPKLSPGLVDGSRSTTPTPIMPASSCFDALDFLSPFAGVVIKPEVLC